jgi:hypothetical protein
MADAVNSKFIYHLIRQDDVNTLMQLMDEHNISPNETVSGDDPILMVALGLGYILDNYEFQPQISKFLVTRGADVNILDGEGNTPLVVAAMRLNYDAVSFLLKNGANPNIKSPSGYTPYQLAIIALEEKQYELNTSNMNSTFKAEEEQRIRDGMKILTLLAPITKKNVNTKRRALEPPMRNITGALTVRGVEGKHLPRNVVWGNIRKFLTTAGPRKTQRRRQNRKKTRSRK